MTSAVITTLTSTSQIGKVDHDSPADDGDEIETLCRFRCAHLRHSSEPYRTRTSELGESIPARAFGQGAYSTADAPSIITLSRIKAESDRSLHTLAASDPNLIGLHNPTDGSRVIRQLFPADITPDTWAVYSMTNVEVRPGDYLFLFRSWWIQIDLDQVLSADPATRYDIHVSMKFVGPAYGGSAARKDAVFIDRVVLVER